MLRTKNISVHINILRIYIVRGNHTIHRFDWKSCSACLTSAFNAGTPYGGNVASGRKTLSEKRRAYPFVVGNSKTFFDGDRSSNIIAGRTSIQRVADFADFADSPPKRIKKVKMRTTSPD